MAMAPNDDTSENLTDEEQHALDQYIPSDIENNNQTPRDER